MNGHEELFHRFLCEWLEWARSFDKDDEEHHSFSPSTGLCCCLENWLDSHGYYWSGFDTESSYVYANTLRVLSRMLSEDGLCPTFPFGQEAYDKDAHNGTAHKNKDRVLWVENTIKKLEAK